MARQNQPAPAAPAPGQMAAYQAAFGEWEAVRGYSPRTIEHRRLALDRFIVWCAERGIERPQDVTRPILERYQRAIYHHRKANGQPLGVAAQVNLLIPIRAWFKWMARQNHVLWNPAADLELPRQPKRLPRGLLSVAEIETALAHADPATASGLRMRALLETFYSTGIRRMEAVNLTLHDIDTERGALMVRQGKGNKDRIVPLGEPAVEALKAWRAAMPSAATLGCSHRLFLTSATTRRVIAGHWAGRWPTPIRVLRSRSCLQRSAAKSNCARRGVFAG